MSAQRPGRGGRNTVGDGKRLGMASSAAGNSESTAENGGKELGPSGNVGVVGSCSAGMGESIGGGGEVSAGNEGGCTGTGDGKVSAGGEVKSVGNDSGHAARPKYGSDAGEGAHLSDLEWAAAWALQEAQEPALMVLLACCEASRTTFMDVFNTGLLGLMHRFMYLGLGPCGRAGSGINGQSSAVKASSVRPTPGGRCGVATHASELQERSSFVGEGGVSKGG